jgi:type IV pilus assembly protein PilX
MKTMKINPKNKQQGATLIVAILFLLVITVLGISAWQIGNGEEKMASLTRDRQIAYEAAEAALRDAEFDITGICAPGNVCTPRVPALEKLRSFDEKPTNPATPVTCTAAGLCTAPGDKMARQIGQVPVNTLRCGLGGPSTVCGAGQSVTYGRFTRAVGAASPYVISTGNNSQRLAFAPRYTIQAACVGMGNGGTGGCDARRIYYIITAIGFGQRPGTEVVLQTYYQVE